jgi:hypothetical protein
MATGNYSGMILTAGRQSTFGQIGVAHLTGARNWPTFIIADKDKALKKP